VAYEAIGDFDNALKNYSAAADLQSSEPVVVTVDRAWRGRPVSDMAAESAQRLERRIKKMDPAEVHAIMLAVRGVSAANQNDWLSARQDFSDAFSIDPSSAFSLNNRGYVAERDGDLETAQFFYDKARKAGGSNERVGLATQHSAEGKRLSAVAIESNHHVGGELDKYSLERHRETGPIELTPRGSLPAGDSEKLPAEHSPSDAPSNPPPSALSQYPHEL
jgi:tetratricopeptide (TPR) repeat protein